MIRQTQSRFHYDPGCFQAVRIQTDGLCAKLDELAGRLMARSLKFEDLKEDFERLYQPDALALAEAMLHYVPDNDPRIMLITRIGNLRTFKSDDITTIGLPLDKQIAFTQIKTIVKMLRDLTCYLPQN